MNKCDVRSEGAALAYITHCTLATVCHMASLKSPSKSELAIQISIAQTAIDWMIDMKVDFSTTRAKEVVEVGSVQLWADKFRQK